MKSMIENHQVRPHVRKYVTTKELVTAIVEKFNWMERMNLRVGAVWMHPADIDFMKDLSTFDRIASKIVQKQSPDLRGYLFGAAVFESALIPEEHIVLLPDGFDFSSVKLSGPESSIPL